MTQSFIRYQVTPVNLSEHLFEVSLHADLGNEAHHSTLALSLPAWIPGSYMIRDFARNIIELRDPKQMLVINKVDKQTWQLESKDGSAISKFTLVYRVFAFDLSVRSAYINHEYAFFNGTSVLLCLKGFEASPHYLEISLSEDTKDWEVVTAMPSASDDDEAKHQYVSASYDILIDHPVLIGDICKRSFEVRGVVFHLVFTGKETMDLDRISEDLVPICRHHIDLFEECPVDEYYFMTLLCENGFGGLEHKSSTVLQFARFDLPMKGDPATKTESYQQFLSLCSHELFHTWHVKRLRPQAMLEPDLSKEVYTPQLWIYEGFTSLYDDLTLARSGLISPLEYCQILGQSFTRLMRNPGRHLQSISESSFDAWTRFYKQDANSVNHIVSYYLKGSIVALALDITLRQQTQNKHSLDDLMRQLWQRYGRNEMGTANDVIAETCKDAFGIDISSFLHVAVNTTMDLPLNSMLASIGLNLHMRTRESNADKGGKPSANAINRDIGASFSEDAYGMKVSQVLANSAAAESGLQLNDVILACDNFRAQFELFTRQLQSKAEGENVKLHVMRDHQLVELHFTCKAAVADTCYLTIDNETRFKDWLGLQA